MNLVVWIMVFTTYGTTHVPRVITGAEFQSQKKCEDAAELIVAAVKLKQPSFVVIDKPLCVRIEK